MAYFMSYDGIRDNATYKLDTTTRDAIKADPKQIVGKVVAITGDYTVGYGEDGNLVAGVVEAVELVSGGKEDYVVTVAWHKMSEGIPCTSGDAAGDPVTVDGKGGVKKKADGAYTGCVIVGIESDTVATVQFK